MHCLQAMMVYAPSKPLLFHFPHPLDFHLNLIQTLRKVTGSYLSKSCKLMPQSDQEYHWIIILPDICRIQNFLLKEWTTKLSCSLLLHSQLSMFESLCNVSWAVRLLVFFLAFSTIYQSTKETMDWWDKQYWIVSISSWYGKKKRIQMKTSQTLLKLQWQIKEWTRVRQIMIPRRWDSRNSEWLTLPQTQTARGSC